MHKIFYNTLIPMFSKFLIKLAIVKNMKQKKILFPNFSKRRKVIERVFSFLTDLGAERCKSRSPQGFQLKLEMILLAYSLLLKSAKSPEPRDFKIFYRVSSHG